MIRPNPSQSITNAHANTFCKCGCRLELGSATVISGGIRINVGLSATGVVWPVDVTLPKDIADVLEPMIRSAWLQTMGEQWELAAAKGIGR